MGGKTSRPRANHDQPPSVAVCVITRQRPAKLARLLETLGQIETPVAMRWTQTVVVDNDDDRSAESILRKAKHSLPTLAITAGHEAVPGVSAARNRAVEMAETDWIAFIDDDVVPSDRWLVELVDEALSSNADAAIGPVQIDYEVTPPRGLRESGVLDFPTWTAGEAVETFRTGNGLVRKAVLPDPPFRAELSSVGGEDHHLGRTLVLSGCKVVYADSAWASELTPADRLSVVALNRRQRRIGNALVAVESLLKSDGFSSTSSVSLVASAIARVAIGSAMRFPVLPARTRFRGHQLFWVGIGQIEGLLGRRLSYYGG